MSSMHADIAGVWPGETDWLRTIDDCVSLASVAQVLIMLLCASSLPPKLKGQPKVSPQLATGLLHRHVHRKASLGPEFKHGPAQLQVVAWLGRSMDAPTATIDSLIQRLVSENTARIRALEEEVLTHKRQNSELERNLSSLQLRSHHQETDLAAARAANTVLRGGEEVIALQRNIRDLRDMLQRRTEELEALQSTAQQQRTQGDDLQPPSDMHRVNDDASSVAASFTVPDEIEPEVSVRLSLVGGARQGSSSTHVVNTAALAPGELSELDVVVSPRAPMRRQPGVPHCLRDTAPPHAALPRSWQSATSTDGVRGFGAFPIASATQQQPPAPLGPTQTSNHRLLNVTARPSERAASPRPHGNGTRSQQEQQYAPVEAAALAAANPSPGRALLLTRPSAAALQWVRAGTRPPILPPAPASLPTTTSGEGRLLAAGPGPQRAQSAASSLHVLRGPSSSVASTAVPAHPSSAPSPGTMQQQQHPSDPRLLFPGTPTPSRPAAFLRSPGAGGALPAVDPGAESRNTPASRQVAATALTRFVVRTGSPRSSGNGSSSSSRGGAVAPDPAQSPDPRRAAEHAYEQRAEGSPRAVSRPAKPQAPRALSIQTQYPPLPVPAAAQGPPPPQAPLPPPHVFSNPRLGASPPGPVHSAAAAAGPLLSQRSEASPSEAQADPDELFPSAAAERVRSGIQRLTAELEDLHSDRLRQQQHRGPKEREKISPTHFPPRSPAPSVARSKSVTWQDTLRQLDAVLGS